MGASVVSAVVVSGSVEAVAVVSVPVVPDGAASVLSVVGSTGIPAQAHRPVRIAASSSAVRIFFIRNPFFFVVCSYHNTFSSV